MTIDVELPKREQETYPAAVDPFAGVGYFLDLAAIEPGDTCSTPAAAGARQLPGS